MFSVHVTWRNENGSLLLCKIIINLTIRSHAAILGFHPLREKLTYSRWPKQQKQNKTMSLQWYTDTAISCSPQASDIDELPCFKYAASAMWVHNKLWLPSTHPHPAGGWSDWAVSNKLVILLLWSQYVSSLVSSQACTVLYWKKRWKEPRKHEALFAPDKAGLRSVCSQIKMLVPANVHKTVFTWSLRIISHVFISGP